MNSDKAEPATTEEIKEPERVAVYEIDLSKKYVLAFYNFIPDDQYQRIREDIGKWLESKDSPFLFIRGYGSSIKLVKVDEE